MSPMVTNQVAPMPQATDMSKRRHTLPANMAKVKFTEKEMKVSPPLQLSSPPSSPESGKPQDARSVGMANGHRGPQIPTRIEEESESVPAAPVPGRPMATVTPTQVID